MNSPGIPAAPPGFLTVGDAARRLGLTHRDVYRLIDKGQLPAVRADRGLVVAAPDVDALVGRC